eukprot:scaffold2911_cov414-Prasinococcus_capsulatus_cf.AAC.40
MTASLARRGTQPDNSKAIQSCQRTRSASGSLDRSCDSSSAGQGVGTDPRHRVSGARCKYSPWGLELLLRLLRVAARQTAAVARPLGRTGAAPVVPR